MKIKERRKGNERNREKGKEGRGEKIKGKERNRRKGKEGRGVKKKKK